MTSADNTLPNPRRRPSRSSNGDNGDAQEEVQDVFRKADLPRSEALLAVLRVMGLDKEALAADLVEVLPGAYPGSHQWQVEISGPKKVYFVGDVHGNAAALAGGIGIY